jgi:hypothetical protein
MDFRPDQVLIHYSSNKKSPIHNTFTTTKQQSYLEPPALDIPLKTKKIGNISPMKNSNQYIFATASLKVAAVCSVSSKLQIVFFSTGAALES